MDIHDQSLRDITRRHFFRRGTLSIGSMALASLLNERVSANPSPASVDPLTSRPTHFPPRVKNVIFLFMCGGPSHVDLLDPKPKLSELDQQPVPEELIQGERFAFITGRP